MSLLNLSSIPGEESSEDLKNTYSKYLQESQVFPKLLEIFEKLQKSEVKPKNPMDFICEELGGKLIPMEEMQSLEQSLDDANNEIRRLRSILKKIGVKYDETFELISGTENNETPGDDEEGNSDGINTSSV